MSRVQAFELLYLSCRPATAKNRMTEAHEFIHHGTAEAAGNAGNNNG
jgi:hypothetical protein